MLARGALLPCRSSSACLPKPAGRSLVGRGSSRSMGAAVAPKPHSPSDCGSLCRPRRLSHRRHRLGALAFGWDDLWLAECWNPSPGAVCALSAARVATQRVQLPGDLFQGRAIRFPFAPAANACALSKQCRSDSPGRATTAPRTPEDRFERGRAYGRMLGGRRLVVHAGTTILT